MAQFILGIDAGGTAVKAAVYSMTGDELGVTAESFVAVNPEPGHNERDSERLWSGLCAVIRAAMHKAGVTKDEIAAVGITGHGNGMFLVDANGRPTCNGILSTDIRTVPMMEEWIAQGKEAEKLALTYKHFWPAQPGLLLAWFKRHRPEALAASAYALSCKDYLRFRLTGEAFAELTDHSTGTLVGGASRQRDPRLFRLYGIEDEVRLLPPLIEPFARAGSVTARAAAETGLRAGTPVPAGACDNIAVMLGTGAIADGEVVVMAGTWGLHQVQLSESITDGSMGDHVHGLTPGRYLYCEGSPASAGAFDWFVETFLRRPGEQEGRGAIYDRCNAAIEKTDPRDPPVFFLPFLNGAFDNVRARGGLVGFATWHHLGHAVRAIYEGVAFEHRRHHERLRWRTEPPKRARFCGGAVRSRPWAEIFASALDLTLDVPQGAEFGARGVAMLAGMVCGFFPDVAAAAKAMTRVSHTVEPNPELRATLNGRFAAYRRLHQALAPHWNDVSA